MADKSAIEWTEATWPITTGCDHVSPGCDHCYAASLTGGRLAHVPAYAGLAEGGRFNGKVRLLPERLDQPLRWKRPRRIFVCSMSDLFYDQVPDEFIARAFAVMGLARQHTFQVLTKRHGRMRSLLSSLRFRGLWFKARHELASTDAVQRGFDSGRIDSEAVWPLPNVWLGVSVEDQKRADLRVPALLDTPAAVRWLSCEPLLGPVDLTFCAGVNALEQDWIGEVGVGAGTGAPHPFIDWVVVGGESGPGARPMDLAWARSLVGQCRDARVPVFVKQLGEHWARDHYYAGEPVARSDRHGGDPHFWPADLRVREYPAVTR